MKDEKIRNKLKKKLKKLGKNLSQQREIGLAISKPAIQTGMAVCQMKPFSQSPSIS